ncbi:DNA primase [Streptomyces sp. SID1328]|uniref:bifunctional DNA primase/polymerase n=1 Tax=Streptomyces sp. SID1328 TaxID=2690250 RepID=UPI00136C0203|nr:bifunctional DNA primase/polymerase [Streptomyces sp. SID1328]MYV40981.1 DNA primase [Streptomyces sp. SID1328]
MLDELGFSPSCSVADAVTRPPGGPLETALACAAHGWPVLPLAPRRKTPAANCARCQGSGHSPTTCKCIAVGRWCHGFHAATADAKLIRRWWRSQPQFGVGVACGAAGLLVLDIDAHETPLPQRERLLPGIMIGEHVRLDGLRHGFHSLALLAALRQEEDPARDRGTLRVRTPSGGMHVWYKTQAGQNWMCSTGSSPRRALAWQVDVRAQGGYIVAPNTVTASGRYEVLPGSRFPAPLPGWLDTELTRTGHQPTPVPRQSIGHTTPFRARQAVIAAGAGRDTASRILAAALATVADCRTTPEGASFTEKLNRAAFTTGGLVAAGHLAQHVAETVLLEAAEHARPGQQRRCTSVVRAGLAAGMRRPLVLKDDRP